jgi:preprotein translocase subunit Sss1
MPNKESKDSDKSEVQKRLKEIEEKSKNTGKKKQKSIAEQIATRSKIERDFKEDTIRVSFNTSPETKRTILARRPNNDEYIQILKLGVQATKFEKSGDAESIEGLTDILDKFGDLAADLTLDKSLDQEFWRQKVSSITLQNFINSLMSTSQTGYGGVSEEDLNSFRKK